MIFSQPRAADGSNLLYIVYGFRPSTYVLWEEQLKRVSAHRSHDREKYVISAQLFKRGMISTTFCGLSRWASVVTCILINIIWNSESLAMMLQCQVVLFLLVQNLDATRPRNSGSTLIIAKLPGLGSDLSSPPRIRGCPAANSDCPHSWSAAHLFQ